MLVFLAMSALITLVVGEFDLSVASIMGLGRHHRAGPRGPARHEHLAGLPDRARAPASWPAPSTPSSWWSWTSRRFVVTLGTGTLLIGLAQCVSSRTSSRCRTRLQHLALVRGARDAGVVLLRHRPRRAARLPDGLDAARAQHGVRRCQPRGGPPGRHPGASASGSAPTCWSSLWRAWPGWCSWRPSAGSTPTSSGQYLLPALAAVFLGTAVVQPGMFNPIGTMIAIYFLCDRHLRPAAARLLRLDPERLLRSRPGRRRHPRQGRARPLEDGLTFRRTTSNGPHVACGPCARAVRRCGRSPSRGG